MMLTPKPEERISMEDIFRHPWLQGELPSTFVPYPFPNSPTSESINMSIVNHIVHSMRLDKISEVSLCYKEVVTMVTYTVVPPFVRPSW